MPSADFSTFLAKCFSCRDEISAIGVLNESGLWDQAAQKTVKTCYEFQWEEWFYPLPECLPEIVAVHLLSNRADSIHISNSSTILMMAQGSLFVHAGEIKWNQKNLHKLFLKTNSLLASYYPKKNFPDTSPPRLKTVADLEGIKTPENNRIFDWLKNESPSVREYFFYSDMRSSVTTDYSLRCFGVDDEGSGKRIRDSGFFLVENDEDACLRMLTKADLTAIATQVNMSTRKGWKKEELFSEILKNPEAKQLALQKTPEHRKIKRNPDFSEEWDAIIRFKEQALPVCWAIASL